MTTTSPSRLRSAITNPWGKSRMLPLVTLLYVLWSIIPVGDSGSVLVQFG